MPELSVAAEKTSDIGGFTRSEVAAHYSEIKTLVEDTEQ